MASSASSYDARCYDVAANNMRAIKYCRRSALGVTAGCIGCVASLAVVAARMTCAPSGSGDGVGGGDAAAAAGWRRVTMFLAEIASCTS